MVAVESWWELFKDRFRKSKMVSFVSCLKHLVLVRLREEEIDFEVWIGLFIGKDRETT